MGKREKKKVEIGGGGGVLFFFFSFPYLFPSLSFPQKKRNDVKKKK